MSQKPSAGSKQSLPGGAPRAGRRLWRFTLPLLALGGVWAGVTVMFFSRPSEGDGVRPEETSPPGHTDSRGQPSGEGTSSRAAAAKGPASGAVSPGAGPDADALRGEELRLWMKRLERARQTLDTYRAATRYPHESRPLSEHPDQVYPNRRIDSEQRFAKQGQSPRADSDTRLQVSQERVYVVGEESVRFTVHAQTGAGAPLPLRVVAAQVAPAPDESSGNAGVGPLPLAFTDDGQNGDEVPGDGTLTARLQPSQTPLAQHAGALRVSVALRAGEEEGETYFDIFYTPSPPARFTGRFREAVEGGSLVLYLGVEVKRPGRYVVTGRVDDAADKPFALATFNEELSGGPKEVKLTVFGKLIREGHPAFPLKLRDTDAFLLKENVFPDRELLPRLSGVVYTTKGYPETSFSDAEWEGEERERYLQEYQKDVDAAQREVDARRKP